MNLEAILYAALTPIVTYLIGKVTGANPLPFDWNALFVGMIVVAIVWLMLG